MKRPGKRYLAKMARKMARKNPRIDLQIAKGLDALMQLPESVLSDPEQTILRRMQDIHRGVQIGRLTQADYNNMKRIAARHRIRLR